MRTTCAMLLLLAACGGGEETEEPPPTKPGNARLHGVLAGEIAMGEGMEPGAESGEAFVTLQGPLVPDATEQVTGKGTLTVGELVAPLAGTYDTEGILRVDGGSYFLTASTVGPGILRGTYEGPGSSGQIVLLRSGAAAFCGTFTGGLEAGPLVWVEAPDSTIHGVLTSVKTSYVSQLQGRRTGDTVELRDLQNNWRATAKIVKDEHQTQATSGTYDFDRGGGVFSASEHACSGG